MSIPEISDAEWVVMRVIWSSGDATANQVIAALSETTDWKPKTVKTLLGRLVKKRVLGYERDTADTRSYVYHPLVSERECIRRESRSFLERVFGGAVGPAVVNFLAEEQLTPADIDKLKNILEAKRKEVEDQCP